MRIPHTSGFAPFSPQPTASDFLPSLGMASTACITTCTRGSVPLLSPSGRLCGPLAARSPGPHAKSSPCLATRSAGSPIQRTAFLNGPSAARSPAGRGVRRVMASASAGGESVHVSLSELRELCTKALKVVGYTSDEVKVLLEVSVGAEGTANPPCSTEKSTLNT